MDCIDKQETLPAWQLRCKEAGRSPEWPARPKGDNSFQLPMSWHCSQRRLKAELHGAVQGAEALLVHPLPCSASRATRSQSAGSTA